MASRIKLEEQDIPRNRICVSCRRSCKQPDFAIITSCPRYYPLHKKSVPSKEWKQAELFTDV